MRALEPTSIRYRAYRHALGKVRIVTVESTGSRSAKGGQAFVLMQPRFVGVCSADIREVRGERPGRRDFGHEVVGSIVDSTHPTFIPGDSVILNPFVEIERETAFAEKMGLTAPAHRLQSALIKVPALQRQYAISEPLACVIHAAHRCLAAGEEPKLVFGAGFFGFLLYSYLDHHNVPVTLANRSPERLRRLMERSQHLRGAFDLQNRTNEFATVFLMQSRISSEDISTAARLLRKDGEMVLFGAVDSAINPELHAIRNQQLRIHHTQEGKSLYLQGTLDATPPDLQEAVRMLSRREFVARIAPIFAPSLTFEQGADHLTQRAVSPQSYHKYVIDMPLGTPDEQR